LVQVAGGTVVTSMGLEVCDFVVLPRQLDFWGKNTPHELGLSMDFVCSRARCGKHLEELGGPAMGSKEAARSASWESKRSRTRLVVGKFIMDSVKKRDIQCADDEAYAFRCPKALLEDAVRNEASADYGVSFSQEF
jgi:hypothetical protein